VSVLSPATEALLSRRCVIGKSIKEMVGHRCIVAPFAGADANQMGPSGKEWHRSASASVEIVAFVNNATPAQSNYVGAPRLDWL